MTTSIVLGSQWGDEGKGRVVDLLAEKADIVVRYSGGANSGHIVVPPGYKNKIVLRSIPSGIVRPNVKCVIGPGTVVDLQQLVTEMSELNKLGISTDPSRLLISNKAHLVLSYHIVIDTARESAASAIGTTKRGIGPAYEDKARRTGIQLHTIKDVYQLKVAIERSLAGWNTYPGLPTAEQVITQLKPYIDLVRNNVCDTDVFLSQNKNNNILLEGAQGTLLDIDHGSYPYVTSSSNTSGGACTGSGISPVQISNIIGITKAYTTRVGNGPFPTELNDKVGTHLQSVGKEFGSVTGRTRRCGWLDLAALKYATMINGFTELILTKIDVLTGLDTIQACIGYDIDFASHDLDKVKHCHYESFDGWNDVLDNITKFNDLPYNVRSYINYIESFVNVPITMVSVGPGRNSIICR